MTRTKIPKRNRQGNRTTATRVVGRPKRPANRQASEKAQQRDVGTDVIVSGKSLSVAGTKPPTTSKRPPGGVENVAEIEAKLTKLSPAQVTVLHMVAEWEKPSAILEEVTQYPGAEHITESWVKKVSSEACRPEWAKPIVVQFREEFLKTRDEIPCRHLAYRLSRLQRIIERCKDDRTILQALREAHEQSGDKVERVADVTGPTAIQDVLDQLERAEAGNDHGQRN